MCIDIDVYLLETTNTIDFVSRVDNSGGTSLCSREHDVDEIRGVGDRPHLLEVVDWHLSFFCFCLIEDRSKSNLKC